MSISSPSHDAEFAVVELVARAAPHSSVVADRPLGEMAFRTSAWSPGEVLTLREMFAADESIEKIAEDLGRPVHGLRSKICALGLRRNSTRVWTDTEDAELRRRYGLEATATLAQHLARSCTAVYARAGILGLSEGNPPGWTDWEDAQLAEGYRQGLPVAQIAVLIGRPISGTASRASTMGLKHPAKPAGWSEAELARALELAETEMPYSKIRLKLAQEGFPLRSKAGFQPRLRKAGYGRGWGKAWLPEEDDLLRKAYETGTSLTALRLRLGRSQCSIRWRADYLGLRGTHAMANGFRGGPDWKDDELTFLRENYGRMSGAKLAECMGRTKAAVYTKANVLGLVHGYIRPWSQDEMEALRIAHDQGIAIADLAEALGRNPISVSKFATNHEFRFGRRSVREVKLTLQDILGLRKGEGEGRRDRD
ncbi:hypothetical protein [Erythrobacter donghaensis]|jgi:hypothetical protein|uniref:hypothetical protein n=1 Tax=Erythrobacter donghaensis TaxID=267135 RepID=UPI00093DB5F5|nr:hypothetical protein [Erythrobacter donghaensis]